MKKKSWIVTLLGSGFSIFLFIGITSGLAVEGTLISDILADPSAYEGIEVEVTGTIVEMDFGLLIEDDSGAQIRVLTQPLWYMVNPYGAELRVTTGDVITVVGTVHTGFSAQEETSAVLIPLEINGVSLPEYTGTFPWAGGRGRFRTNQNHLWGQGCSDGISPPRFFKQPGEIITTEPN